MPTRNPADTDFFIDLPGVGRFRYGRRTFGDRIRIRAEYLRLTGGQGEGDIDLSIMGALVAQHAVLCVSAPVGWADLESMDMTATPGANDRGLMQLYDALKEKEDSFRLESDKGREGARAGDGGDGGAVVPPAVPALPA